MATEVQHAWQQLRLIGETGRRRGVMPWHHTPEQRRDELLASANYWRDRALAAEATVRFERLSAAVRHFNPDADVEPLRVALGAPLTTHNI